LNEGVKVLNLVSVAGSVGVHTSHTSSFGSSKNTDLSLVDIVVDTVHQCDNNASRDTLENSLHVVDFVDGTGTELVLVDGAHSPTERTAFLTKVGMVLFTSFLEHTSIGFSGILVGDAVPALRYDFR